jgi:hypothetical protein
MIKTCVTYWHFDRITVSTQDNLLTKRHDQDDKINKESKGYN